MLREQPAAASKPTRRTSATQLMVSLIIVALIASQAWLFYRIYNLEKSVLVAQSKITSLEGKLTSVESELVTAQSNIATLASGLEYATALAENANRYAHSHDNFSDARLKTSITDIPNALDNILAMRGVRFYWKTRDFPEMSFSDKPQIGFIAQEIERIYPELVLTGTDGYKMVDYARLTPILVEAIKEQQATITALQQRVSALEKER